MSSGALAMLEKKISIPWGNKVVIIVLSLLVSQQNRI